MDSINVPEEICVNLRNLWIFLGLLLKEYLPSSAYKF